MTRRSHRRDHDPTVHATLKHLRGEATHKSENVEGAHKDALVVIHDAFDIARRRLDDSARRQRGDVKIHHVAPSSGT